MNKVFYLFSALLCLTVLNVKAQKIIFLHHSTGSNVYKEGNVPALIDSYNKENGATIEITERAFPYDPWPWANYPYDYWKLWIGGACNRANPNIECMNKLAANHDLIILKHCYPGADIKPDKGKPDVSSDEKTIGNYKEQYRALRSLFDSYPGTKFMVWTLVPLHRLATTPEVARRANEFVQWVNNEWLTEDSRPHSNIIVFDYFSHVAEYKDNPSEGIKYCLKYDFERSHAESDSHPNTAANIYVGPLFVKSITDAVMTK